MFAPSRRLLASIVVLLGFAVALPAATYHVAPGGDDTNPGTLEQPFRTVKRGADVLKPGDTLLLRHGTYFEKVVFAASGTPDQRITIAGFPGEMAVIDGRNVLPEMPRSDRRSHYLALVLVSGSNVDLRDVWVRRSRGRGLQIGERPALRAPDVPPTRDVLVRNVRVSEAWDAGLGTYGTERTVLEECEVFECVQRNAPPRRGLRPWSVSLIAVDANDTTIRRCTVYRGHGEGLGDLRSTGTLIEDTVTYDHLKVTMYLDNSRDSTVRRNFLFSTDDRTFWRAGVRPTPGLSISNEPYPKQNFGHGQTVINNLIYNTGSGLSIWNFRVPGTTYTDSVIAHNTFASNRPPEQAGIGLGINSFGSTNIAFRNNIVSWSAARIADGSTTGWTYSHNAWSARPPEAFAGQGDVVDASLWPWPGGERPDATALRLPAGATPIDAGAVLAQVTGDYFGTTRGDRPDIGLHEFTTSPAAFRAPGIAHPWGARLAVSPVAPNAGVSTADYLRGFSDAELAAARRLVPASPEGAIDTPAPRTVTVTGRVFVDMNQNREADQEEPGLAGVAVTDGAQIVRSGEDGAYRITFEVDEERHYRFVAVAAPNGHVPLGPWFERIPAADKDPAYRADFSLVADERSAGREFSFVATSDSQFTTPEEMVAMAKDYAQMTGGPGKPAFLVTAGDLTIVGSNWQWDMYDRIRGAARIPVYDGFGGHDGNARRSTVDFEERIGPAWYSWNYGGVHFVHFITETGYLRPKAKARQAAWLEADLRSVTAGTPIVMISHTPMGAEWYDRLKADGHNLVAHITGHFHAVQAGSRNGVPVLMNGPARGRDWGAFTNTYRFIRVADGKVSSELRVAGQYDRLECLAPAAETRLGAQPLVVLAHDSAKDIAQVTCTLTSPRGTTVSPQLRREGDWSWHGEFTPDVAGEWRIDLVSTDGTGAERRESRMVRVTAIRQAGGPGADLQPVWVRPTGSVHVQHASPTVAGGRVYVAVTNPNAGNPGAGVLCLEATTGRELWRAPTPGGDIRGMVTVHQGRVHVVTGEGWTAAYDAGSGRLLWSNPLDEKSRAGRPLALNVSSPLPTADGLLVPDWKTPQVLLDPATGRELGRIEAETGNYAARPFVAGATMFTAARGVAAARKLPAGEVLWSIPEAARATSTGVVAEGRFYYNTNSGLQARDAATGASVWHRPLASVGFHPAAPVVWDDLVLANGTDFTAVDRRTGEVRWTVPCGREAERFVRSQRQSLTGSSSPVIAGGFAYFGHDDGSLRAVDRSGRVAWEFRLGAPVKTTPAVSAGLLFVHDYAGNLWCFAPAGEVPRG